MVLLMRQFSLFPGKIPLHHGGELARGRRKSLRPLSCKRPVHFTLKSRKRIYENRRAVVAELQRQAEKFDIRIYDCAVAHDHLHFLAKLSSRAHYIKFIRALAGLLARKLGAKLWALPPFSRVASWGRDFLELKKPSQRIAKKPPADGPTSHGKTGTRDIGDLALRLNYEKLISCKKIITLLALTLPLTANAAPKRHPAATNTQWVELARFTGSKTLSDVKQSRPIAKEDILNCQFRLAVSTFKDANDITDILYATGVNTSDGYGEIQFLGKPEATLGSGQSPVAAVTIELADDKITALTADGPLARNNRTKILQALCP